MGNENLFKCSRSHDHAHINYVENLQKYFSSEPRGRWLWNLVYSIGYSSTNNISYDDLRLTVTIFMTGSNCFRMLLHGWKLIQHWVLMYFQVCSNSTSPQYWGERYRTNGPLVSIALTFAGSLGWRLNTSALRPLVQTTSRDPATVNASKTWIIPIFLNS